MVGGRGRGSDGDEPSGGVPSGGELSLRVLGDLAVERGGVELALGGPRPRALVASLAAAQGRTVPVSRLVEDLWGEEPPGSADATIASYVSRLRRTIDLPGTPIDESALRRRGSGYVLVVQPEARDDERFRAGLRAAREALRSPDPMAAEHAVALLEAALAEWSDHLLPIDELPPSVRPEARRLDEERLGAVEALAEALDRSGRHDQAAAVLEPVLLAHPLREVTVERLALALHHAGRTVEAVALVRELIGRLDDEFGLEPTPALRRLEADLVGGAPLGAAPVAVVASGAVDGVGDLPRSSGGGDGQARARRAPVALTRLVGRGDLVASILEALGSHRLLTLVGPGGAGKTRVAQELAHRFDAAWAPLADVRRDDLVGEALVGAVGAVPQAGLPALEQLVTALAVAPTVLVVDNAEHVRSSVAAIVGQVLAASATTTVVVTSRTPLGVPGEVVVDVTPLATGGDGGDESPAAALFLDRATAAAPGWVPDEHDRSVTEELCRRLDGLPLALELAAARVRDLAPDEILDGLGSGSDLLSGGSSATPHHASLASAMRWSYDLLDDRDRVALRALAVFDGSFTLADAARVAGGDVSESAARLVADSLLVADWSSRPRRYRMLQVVREWTRAETAAAELAEVRHRLVRWARERVGSVASDLRTPDAGPVLRSLDVDMANVRRAVDAALEAAEGPADELAPDPERTAEDVATAVETVVALRPYWQRNRPAEGVAVLRRGLVLLDSVAEAGRLEADAELTLVRLCWTAGEYALGAEVAGQLALDAARVDHPLAVSVAKGALAVLSVGAGDLTAAAAAADAGIEVAETMDGPDRAEALGNALLARAVVHEASGELEEAGSCHDRAAAAAVDANDWVLHLAIAYYRGRVAFRLGRFDLAALVATTAAGLADDIGVDGALYQHARTLGGALCGLGLTEVGSPLVGAAGTHAAAFGAVPGYADPAFAAELEAVTDAALLERGTTWSRDRLVEVVRSALTTPGALLSSDL